MERVYMLLMEENAAGVRACTCVCGGKQQRCNRCVKVCSSLCALRWNVGAGPVMILNALRDLICVQQLVGTCSQTKLPL